MTEREQLEQAIVHLESQRAVLGDGVVDASIAALREKLAALGQPALTEQRRKQVSVLLADVSGSTAMAETMDAEDVTEMMNALWERLDSVIVQHGGRIDKHMGDAVLALWGAEVAQEDDPEQAIRAALAIQGELASFREERPFGKLRTGSFDELRTGSFDRARGRPVDLAMRIGINTGPVLLGRVGTTGEFTAMGDTVNTTSRLEEAAPVGGILISHDTYRHVRGIFQVQPLPAIQVKGKAEPLQVYVVRGAKPRAFHVVTRGVEGIETRMVGREAEMKQLQEALRAALDGKGRMITITGEAGVGKSRLLYEFENWIELLSERIRYFKGRAQREMQNVPYALIRDLLAFRFQIQESDRASAVRAKLETGIGEALKADAMRAHVIGQWLGFDFSDSPHLAGVLEDAQQLRDRALIYLSEFFQATTEQAPTVIFMEDIHWADDSSLDVIDYLARVTAGRRLLVLCLARPTLFERRPGWGSGQVPYEDLALQPLSEVDSGHLVDEILQRVEQVPPTLHKLVVAGAEGNPFYVEELIKMLIEDGVILKEEARWRVEPGRLTAVRVPPTLTGILQARLDGLAAEERAALQRASVVGRTFWDDAVQYLSTQTEVEDHPPAAPGRIIDQELVALSERELIFRQRPSAFAGTQEFIFKHAILHEVTYESVLKRVRRIYHRLVADWLMEHSADRADEYTGLIADHLELAGERERAAGLLRRAGERAVAQFANTEAVNYLSRALDLTPETEHAQRYALLLARERVYHVQGNRERQSGDLLALERLAEVLDDDRERAEVALRRAYYAEVISDYPRAIAAAQAAIRLAGAAQDAKSEAAGYLEWGRALWHLGDYKAARSQLEQALARARTGGLYQVEADSLRTLGALFFRQSDYGPARASWEQALRTYRTVGDRRGESATLNNLGLVCWSQSDYGGAQAYYEQALQVFREVGYREGESSTLSNLGSVASDQGDYAGARSYLEQALGIKREIGDRQGEGVALNSLGNLLESHGDYGEARACSERALEICREIGDRHGESSSRLILGRVAHQLGDNATARVQLEQALGIYGEVGDRRMGSLARLNLSFVLQQQGEFDEADAQLEQVLETCREIGDRQIEGWGLSHRGFVRAQGGDYAVAQRHYEEALRIFREIGDRSSEAWGLTNLGWLCHHLGDDQGNQMYSRQALQMAQELGDRPTQGDALVNLGHALSGLGQLTEAAAAYRSALEIRRGLGQRHLAMEPLAGLARVSLAQGDLDEAQRQVGEILAYLERDTLEWTDEPFPVYLTCYRVLEAGEDPHAGEVLDRAYHLLMERAAKIKGQEQRRLFLENVAAQREIVKAWEGSGRLGKREAMGE